MLQTRTQKAVVIGTLALVIAFFAQYAFHFLPQRGMVVLSNGCQLATALFAAASCLLYAGRSRDMPRTRRIAWTLIGLNSAAWTLGQASYMYYDAVLRVHVPCPGWPDVGFLLQYPPLWVGVILLFGSVPVAGRARLLLDNVLVAGAAGVLSWGFLVQPMWSHSHTAFFSKLVFCLYPLADLGALFCALALAGAASSGKISRAMPLALAAGVAVNGFTDTVTAYFNFTNSYHTGMWTDAGFIIGPLLIGYAPLTEWWRQEKAQTETAKRPLRAPMLITVAGPYLAAGGAFALAAWHDYADDHIIGAGTFAAGIFLLVLVIGRQVLTLLENRHLTSQVLMFNESLEQVVGQRTRQLASVHRLTRAVNTTLDVDQVIEVALLHAQEAAEAEGVVLWLAETDVFGERMQRAGQRGLDESPLLMQMDGQAAGEQVRRVVLTDHAQPGSRQTTCLFVPMCWQQTTVGTIAVVRRETPFTEEDGTLLESMGIEVGAALENARRYQSAAHAADHDPVTGLLNHRAIHQRLEGAFAQAKSSRQPLSVLLLDMDNFRLFNETYGHPVGDLALRTVAAALREECLAPACIGRYGADEFLVLLPDVRPDEARNLGMRLRERLGREGYHPAGDARTVPFAVCCGVATFPDDSLSRHELLTLAESSLLVGKRSEGGIAAMPEDRSTGDSLRMDESFGVLDALVASVDNTDRYTRRHCEDVTEYALWIAEEMGLSEETLRVVRIGGLLHDVGKIGVPDEILRKPGRLSEDEYDAIKQHPKTGALFVGAIPGMEMILDAVRSHHERWDGGGYPDALAGEAIPLLGRIMAVADACSAITTERPYRKGTPWSMALREISACSGTQFDPQVAQAFLRAAHRRRPAEDCARLVEA